MSNKELPPDNILSSYKEEILTILNGGQIDVESVDLNIEKTLFFLLNLNYDFKKENGAELLFENMTFQKEGLNNEEKSIIERELKDYIMSSNKNEKTNILEEAKKQIFNLINSNPENKEYILKSVIHFTFKHCLHTIINLITAYQEAKGLINHDMDMDMDFIEEINIYLKEINTSLNEFVNKTISFMDELLTNTDSTDKREILEFINRSSECLKLLNRNKIKKDINNGYGDTLSSTKKYDDGMKESFNQIIHHYSYKLNEIKKISKVKPVKKETLLPTNNTPASPVNQSLQVKQPTPEKSDKTQSLQLPKMVSLNTINDYRKKIDELPYDKIDEEVLREHYKWWKEQRKERKGIEDDNIRRINNSLDSLLGTLGYKIRKVDGHK